MHRRRRNRRLLGKVAGIEADRRSADGAELGAGEQWGPGEARWKAGPQSVIIPPIVQLQPNVEQRASCVDPKDEPCLHGRTREVPSAFEHTDQRSARENSGSNRFRTAAEVPRPPGT